MDGRCQNGTAVNQSWGGGFQRCAFLCSMHAPYSTLLECFLSCVGGRRHVETWANCGPMPGLARVKNLSFISLLAPTILIVKIHGPRVRLMSVRAHHAARHHSSVIDI